MSRIAGIAVACVALLLAAPAGAWAGEDCHRRIESTTYDLQLRGSHGYEIEIESFPSGKVSLSAERRDRFAQYMVQGRSAESGLKADFGPLGRIAIHFRPQGPVRYAGEPVRFEGRIEFHGEDGFTSVSRRQARGAVFRRFRRSCSRPPKGDGARASRAGDLSSRGTESVTTLAAAERTANRAVVLRLESSRPPVFDEEGEGDFILASLEERRQGMSIWRGLRLGSFGEKAVTVGSSGAGSVSGSVAPPRPFSGSAAFSGVAGAPTSWSGDLTVTLPGA